MNVNSHPYLRRFYSEHIPSASPGSDAFGIEMRAAFTPIPRISRRDAHAYIDAVQKDIVRDYGAFSYKQFKRRLVEAIATLHKLSENSPHAVREVAYFHPDGKPVYVQTAYKYLPPRRRHREKVLDVQVNYNHVPQWMSQPQEVVEQFVIRPDVFVHPEAPMYLSVYKRSNKQASLVASVGFRLLSRGRIRPIISINNVQGVSGKQSDLAELSRVFGEHWQVALVKKLIAYAKKNGLKVQGEKPWNFEEDQPLEKREKYRREYRRLVPRYEQTFHNAG
ncbi:hypothetical protein HY571_03005, partial [Candidatus Micrarchaeota archaeon]|nr:hypothetical protein [Candidatus Micrarchaeota archaeon]